MSRALVLIAQSRFLKRPLTPEETVECLRIWVDIAGGERVSIPKVPPLSVEQVARINALHDEGKSRRQIAKAMQLSRHIVRETLIESGRIVACEFATEPA